jgi:hypothetical protein
MIFDGCGNLNPGEAGDDRREGVHVGLEDDIVGNAPALSARKFNVMFKPYDAALITGAIMVATGLGVFAWGFRDRHAR